MNFKRRERGHSALGYVFKVAALLVLAGLMNHIRDMIFGPEEVKPILENFGDALFVGLPVAGLTLMLLLRLDGLHRKLAAQALSDPLTQLPNRRAFFEHAERARDAGACVALVDIDHFKQVNDTFGHMIGDGCLVAVGQVLKEWAGSKNLICRYGGEEFAVLLRETPLQDALLDADRMSKRRRFEVQDQVVNVSLSMGLAEWRDGESLDTVLNHADQALYLAKNSGRAQARAFVDVATETGRTVKPIVGPRRQPAARAIN